MSSLSSSSSSAPTPTSSSTLLMGAPTDYRRLPKCPRTASAIAQRIIEAAVVPSSEPATVPLPTQLDMIRIYNDKNVLFLGDSGARFVYRDLYRILHKDTRISRVDIERQWNHHPCYIHESPMKLVGKDGVSVETNCRMFKKPELSTTLYFIPVDTVIGDNCPINVGYLQAMTEKKPIHFIVVSCAYRDLCPRRLTDCKGDFDGIFADFQLKFPNICTQIREAFPSTSTHDPVIIWLPPAPARLLTAIEDDQFQLLVNTCTKIIKQHKFELIETMEPWVEKRKDLYNETTHFLSPEGVRSLTIAITRQALKILGGPLIMYPIPILPQSLLLRTNPSNKRKLSDYNKRKDDS